MLLLCIKVLTKTEDRVATGSEVVWERQQAAESASPQAIFSKKAS